VALAYQSSRQTKVHLVNSLRETLEIGLRPLFCGSSPESVYGTLRRLRAPLRTSDIVAEVKPASAVSLRLAKRNPAIFDKRHPASRRECRFQ
jgi:hypothetical protein